MRAQHSDYITINNQVEYRKIFEQSKGEKKEEAYRKPAVQEKPALRKLTLRKSRPLRDLRRPADENASIKSKQRSKAGNASSGKGK